MTALLIVISVTLGIASGQNQALMDYLERRLLAIEEHIAVRQEEGGRYASELREFQHQMLVLAEGLKKRRENLQSSLAAVGSRLDRVEREIDYVEIQNPLRPCEGDDKQLAEQPTAVGQQGDKVKPIKLSDCTDMMFSIKAMKILKRSGSLKGVWTKDATLQSGKIYVFDNAAEDILYEFDSLRHFSSSFGLTHGMPVKLPSPWSGTGFAVYNGHVYYVQDGKDLQVVKYDLRNGTIADSAFFPVENPVPVYGLTPKTYIDLAADETGLWVLYANRRSDRNICLAKIDPDTLDIEQMWDTPCPRANAEAAFVVCGTVYVVYNTKLPSRSRVQCVYDVSDMVSSDMAPLLYFPRRYSSHSSLKYHPLERQIYAWDDGYQILYKLIMKRKVEV
ncbi:olfactomedin-like protein 3A [Arapaima gigas]